MPSIKSRLTWVQYLIMTAFLIMGGLTLWAVVTSLGDGDSFWMFLAMSAFGILLIKEGLSTVTTKLEITEHALMINDWGNIEVIWLEEITEINAIPTGFGEPHLLVSTKEKGVAIITSRFANGKLLNRVAIERAYFYNPAVKINGLTRYIYGQPPYGIFDQQADS